ncbi:alpha/beta hydrolase family protein [Streptomyces sp. NBC_01525]|uniref:alpha/beta hydrolase n=1 Tax=Streptomyces sp. NBC_01525 TaxID=2903893 RepID=UPI0038632A29
MVMVLADPEMLDRLAKSMDRKAGEIPRLKARANTLQAGGEVSGLTALAAWLGVTARELRSRARTLRSPSESRFDSLGAFDLPDTLARQGKGRGPAAELKKILDAHKDGPGAHRGVDVAERRAQAVKKYFSGLSRAEQAALAAADPELVGNLDGVPSEIRFAANRMEIQEAFNEESAYLKDLAKDDPRYLRTKKRVDTLRRFMSPRVMEKKDPGGRRVTVEVPRQFLVFDAHYGTVGDPKSASFADGRVAEVVGDLENAKKVLLRVPGVTSRLDGFDEFAQGGYDLVRAGYGKVEDPDTAVISWQGYDAPEYGDSLDPEKAVAGGKDLAEFRSGISVNLRKDARVDIFAHSYGTLVTAKAIQSGLKNVDNIVFMGSPGLGPGINSVADLHMPGTKFYAMRAPEDFVSYTEGHGKDPADFKGITRLATDRSHRHSEYYKEDSESMNNLQRILFGDTEALTFEHATLDEEMMGAQELRMLVAFLRAKVPPDVANKMGRDLDPILQNKISGRAGMTDLIGPIQGVLDKYHMLDRVTPQELQKELVALSGSLTYKQTCKAVEGKGAPAWVARAAGGSAMLAATKLLDPASHLVAKGMELERLMNDVGDLFSGDSLLADGVRTVGAAFDLLN